MLTKLLNIFSPERFSKEVEEIPIVKVGRFAINQYWLENQELIKDFPQDFVEEQADKMLQNVIDIAVNDDPRMRNRKRLADWVITCARFQVLVIKPPPEEDETGLRGKFGISGELRERLVELAEKDKNLKEFMYGIGASSTWEDVWNPVLLRYRVTYAWMHLFHTLRAHLDDMNLGENDDWFQLFFTVMCGWQEHQYREVLGLPSKLDFLPIRPDAQAIILGTFTNRVLEGHRYPDLEWKESLEDFNQGKSFE